MFKENDVVYFKKESKYITLSLVNSVQHHTFCAFSH